MRPYKVYKDYDRLDLEQKEQVQLAYLLLIQNSICDKYRIVKNHPWLYTAEQTAKAKRLAQLTVTKTWSFFQECFPGLDNSMSVFQYEEDAGKRLDYFFVANKETALAKLVKEENTDRVFTDEWEQMIKEYKRTHADKEPKGN